MSTDCAADQVSISEVQLGEEEIEAAVAVLRSGQLRQGRLCAEFEECFAQFVGARFGIACSSGTAALHLAWLALLQPGEEVLVPAFTFVATASTVVLTGGRPIFCDVDGRTGLLDLADARARLTPRTRAVAPVHLFGNVCDVPAVQALAAERGLAVVWDAAQAHGARWRGQDVGSLPGVVCYSFYPTKNMTTGEGGMIATNDAAMADRLRLLRSHGQSQKYMHTLIGLNYRMMDVQAAIGLAQLERLPGLLARRRANAALLDRLLAGLPGIETPQVPPEVEHAYHQYTIQVHAAAQGRSRDELADALAARGIETAVHYPRPLHQQPVFAAEHGRQALPESERLAGSVLSLPVHPGLTESQLRRVGQAVAAVTSGSA